MTDSTFPDVLATRLRHEPGQPLLTFYDDASAERTELSVTTYANWVAKTANVLLEEMDLEPGDTVRLDLPPHWLVPVFLGAAWTAGLVVTDDPEVAADLVITGPDPAPADAPVLACALSPFAGRLPERPAPGVQDFGLLWGGQPDVFVGLDPVEAGSVAWRDQGGEVGQADLLSLAAGGEAGARLITDVHPASDRGVPAFLGPLLRGGSVVLVRHPDADRWPAHCASERATEVLRAAPRATRH